MDEREIVISNRVLALLRRMPAFSELPTEDILEMFQGKRLLRFREYKAGETILREGDRDSWVYYLISGQVRVLSQEAQVAVLSGYGEIFGEMGPLRGRPRNATVVADTPVVCFAIDLSLLDRFPSEDRKHGSLLFEEVLNDVVHDRLARANLDAAALRRDLAVAASALAGVNDRIRELERRVHELSKENQELRKQCGM
jgi:CRP-like cAMP-binding protein